MRRATLCALGFALAPLLAGAAALTPQDFAYGVPIVTPEEASAYRLAVPLAVYRGSIGENLDDIRVFNAQGELVPYSLRRPDAPAATPSSAKSLPLFPLHADSRLVIDGVRVTIDSPDSSVNLQTQRGGASPVVNQASADQYVLDGRGLDAPVSAFELDWPQTSAEYSGRIRVEASDDLGVWRTVVASAPIANLEANGQQLIERRIELPAAKAKFWRLAWIGRAPPFELSSVLAQPAGSAVEVNRLELDVPGEPDNPKRPGEYLFDLGAHLQVERVNLLLPELNTVIAVDLQSRAHNEDPWRSIAHAGFYRLKTAGGEQANGPIAISMDRDRYWQARVLSTANLPHGALRLQAFWTPSELVFLSRGSGPFVLAYGNSAAGNAEADLASIPAAIPVVAAEVGQPRMLGGPSRLLPPAVPFPMKRTVLWAILLLGVGILSWMAYRLAKDGAGTQDKAK
jgi:Protein of unknown function (DUF3999)